VGGHSLLGSGNATSCIRSSTSSSTCITRCSRCSTRPSRT
jgi:hypothetical protein